MTGPAPSGARGRLDRLAGLARHRTLPPRARGVVLLVAAVATLVAALVAIDRLDLSVDELQPVPLVAAALLVTPLTVLLNAAELRVTALGSGARPERLGWGLATRTVVLATAANLLPVPAGALLRVQALTAAGARLGPAAGVQLAAAGVWVGVSTGLAGAVLLAGEPWWATVFIVVGLAAVVAGLLALRRTATDAHGRVAALLFTVELGTALLHAGRLWLVLVGLGVHATLAQAVVIAAAAPLAAAAGFFPGGIGLAELLSAVLAPLAGLAPAAGLLAVAVARLLGLVVTVPVAAALGLRDVVRAADGGRLPPEYTGDTPGGTAADPSGGTAADLSGGTAPDTHEETGS